MNQNTGKTGMKTAIEGKGRLALHQQARLSAPKMNSNNNKSVRAVRAPGIALGALADGIALADPDAFTALEGPCVLSTT